MIYDNEPILWLPCLNSLWIPLRALRLHYYYSTLKTSPLLVKWRLKYHHELITYHYTQSTCMDRKEALSNFRTFYLTVSHLPSWPTSQCLKIAQKVAFNVASEASYIYFFSGQKLIKIVQNGFRKPET